MKDDKMSMNAELWEDRTTATITSRDRRKPPKICKVSQFFTRTQTRYITNANL